MAKTTKPTTTKPTTTKPTTPGTPRRAREQAGKTRLAEPGTPARKPLRGVSQIRAFFRRNTTPIYFVSPTAFNLLGVDRWVSGFHYVNYLDSFDGTHPRVFVPQARGVDGFGSMEEMNNHLLAHPEVYDLVREKGRGKAVLVMFDEETERLAGELGIEIAMPSAALRHRLDSKLVTTRLGNEAGVPSVPNVLGRVEDYDGLLALSASAGLGEDLVVQLPWGDSGKTTFFVDGRQAFEAAAAEHVLTGVELKVMKRIDCRAVAVEAVLTRHGTLVGPIMADITGHPELTPYQGGWAGNDVHLDVLDDKQRARARVLTEHLGDRLASEGYRGFFEVDYLVDTGSGELYLGELNPRLSGISSMTNVTAGAYAELPLFLFHLLEFLDVDYEIDVAEINSRWADPDTIDVWSQLVIKHTGEDVGLLTEAPATGIWRSGPRGRVTFDRPATDWHDLCDDTEGFYLRIAGPGDYLYKGADIGILVSRGRLQSGEGTLTPLCRRWVDGLRRQVRATPVGELPDSATVPAAK
ncbi:biotin carboxylase [Pseudonocardia hispaniensis]|uniref:Biotin carboxylase n=1 Tax=Pseudonocardia hispaniensis TaxID=904933 RepID=A0ABW1J604_9PSEU